MDRLESICVPSKEQKVEDNYSYCNKIDVCNLYCGFKGETTSTGTICYHSLTTEKVNIYYEK